MKTLVTGAGGFIGSHLAEALTRDGHDVRAFVRYNARRECGWLDESDARDEIEVIAGDIRDSDSLRRALDGCSAVYHLAALIGIPYSYVSPHAYVATNVEGTYNVLEAARTASIETVVITSTSETYGSAQHVPIREDHPQVAQSPYAASKIGADQLALSYQRSFDLPVRIVRPFNTYGPRQSTRAIIPTIIAQVAVGSRRIKLGNLAPTRDFTFVSDTVAGFIAAGTAENIDGETLNIASGAEISVGELARKICDLMDATVELVEEEQRLRPTASEVMRLLGDSGRIREATGWSPAVSLREGLSETIRWQLARMPESRPTEYGV